MQLKEDEQQALRYLLGLWIKRCKYMQNRDRKFDWVEAAALFRVQLVQVSLGNISEATRDSLVRGVTAERNDALKDEGVEGREALAANFNRLIEELQAL